MLTVLGLSDEVYITPCNGRPSRKWICQCDCGNIRHVRESNLLRKDGGATRACGCQKAKVTSETHYIHGDAKEGNWTRLYRTWVDIKTRCYNSNCKSYPRYGGRGIKMCDEWLHSYVAFKEWAEANGYNPELSANKNSIDRIDNDGDYCPENCRWVTKQQQACNRRSNLFLEYNGERKIVTEWAKIVGINWQTIAARVHSGWTDEEALTIPVKREIRNIKDRRKQDGTST